MFVLQILKFYHDRQNKFIICQFGFILRSSVPLRPCAKSNSAPLQFEFAKAKQILE